MKIIVDGILEEIVELLQAIGSSEEQLKVKLSISIKDVKIIFHEVHI